MVVVVTLSVLDESWDLTKGLWATCCLPLSAEEAAGGS